MNPTVTSPPAKMPVTLAEVKAQLNIDTSDYDARLAGLTAAAVEIIETYTGRALITRSYSGFLNWFQHSPRGWTKNYIEIFPGAPLQSVASVTTFDDQDNPTVFDPSQYYVDTARTIGRIVLRRGCVWPIPYRTANAVQIAWTAGYGNDPADIPETIRQAILITVGLLNEQRGDLDALSAETVPLLVRSLLPPPVIPLY